MAAFTVFQRKSKPIEFKKDIHITKIKEYQDQEMISAQWNWYITDSIKTEKTLWDISIANNSKFLNWITSDNMDNFNIYKKLNETGGPVNIHDDNEWYKNHSNTGWKNKFQNQQWYNKLNDTDWLATINMTDMNNIGTISPANE